MPMEIRRVAVQASSGKISEAEFVIWDEDTDDPDLVKLELRSQGRSVARRGADLFSALCSIRREIETEGISLLCYGASKNVYPSPMSRDMGDGSLAYKLTLGQPAKQADLVSIFDTGPDIKPVTVTDQEKFYKEWLASL